MKKLTMPDTKWWQKLIWPWSR